MVRECSPGVFPPEGEPEGFHALWRRAPAMNLRPIDPEICPTAPVGMGKKECDWAAPIT